jgi:hypothetical protein
MLCSLKINVQVVVFVVLGTFHRSMAESLRLSAKMKCQDEEALLSGFAD